MARTEQQEPTEAKTPRSRWYHARWWILAAPFVLYIAICALMLGLEDSLTYFPARYPSGNWERDDPALEDAWFQASDGVRLHGWYLSHPKPVAVMLLAHGNAGNITHRYDQMQALKALGASVLAFDYRGFGRSEGSPTEAGVMQDARAARAWLAKRAGVAESDIVLVGESLGGAVAIDLAAKDGARGVAVVGTFSSLPEVGAYHYPLLPVRTFMRSRFDSLSKIRDYHGPFLQGHGDADTVVPFEFGAELWDAANDNPKMFVRLHNHDHNDPLPPAWYAAVAELLNRLPPPQAEPDGASVD